MNKLARFAFAALPLVFVSLIAPSGAAAQGNTINFRLEPANGTIDIANTGGENCISRQRTVIGNTPREIVNVNDPVGNCPVVRVYPTFAGSSDRPSERTIVKILPITPSVRTRGVSRTVGAAEPTVTTADASLKTAVDTAKAAYDAADAAIKAKGSLKLPAQRSQRGATIAELRDLREKRRAYLIALRAYQAAGDAARKATRDAARHAGRVVDSDGVPLEYRPDGYVPLTGAQYAVYGEDYFLDVAQIMLHPDGTIDPPFFEVRGLQKTAVRDKFARLGLYAASGDTKYNRAPSDGGSIVEVSVKFQAPPPSPPVVELYLAPVDERGGTSPLKIRGPQLEKLGAGVIKPVRLKARLHERYSLETLTADEEIRLKLGKLPGILTLPLPLSTAPATYANNALSGATITYRGKVYSGMQETLTIAAGASTAVTDAFLVLPNGFGGEWQVPAPVVVDATGAPRDVAGELATVGRNFNVVASSTLEGYTDSTKTTRVHPIASASFIGDPRPEEQQIGRGKLSQSMVHVATELNSGFNELVKMRVREPTGGNDALENDFMKRLPDGSFVPLTAGEFPYEYSVVVTQYGTESSGHYVPVFLHDDGLVEGWELFRLRFHETESDATIPSNGTITLRTAYANANGNEVRGELELNGTNYGIAVGAGNSISYRTGGDTANASDLVLTFADSTGVDGTGGADGILSGDELSTTGTWTHNSSSLALRLNGSLPGNLEGHQFVGCKTVSLLNVETAQTLGNCALAALPTSPRTIGFKNNVATVGEGGRAEGDALTLVITPPLDKPVTVRIQAVGLETDSNQSANEAGEFADIRRVQEVQLRAGAETIVNGERSGSSEQKFLIPHLIDDLVVEADETFKLQFLPRAGDPFVVATQGSNAETIVTVKDNDTTTFTVEASPVGQLRRGGFVNLNGRLSNMVQVTAGDVITIDEVSGNPNGANIEFTDSNPNDGYIRGAELTTEISHSPHSIDTLLSGADYSHSYNGVSTGSTALREAAFLFPKRGDPGRAHLRRHADVFYALPKIAPQHAPGSASFSGVIRVSESDMSATVPVSLDYDYDDDNTEDDVVVVVTAHYDADGEGGSPSRSVSKEVTFTSAENATTAKNAQFTAADFNALGIREDEMINRNRVLTTTIAFDTAAQRITKDTVTVFSDQSIRGPDITIEDDDASGGQISLHLSLAGPDGRPITRLEAGQRTDAYLMAEVREVGDRNAARKVALDSALSVGIALTTGANWLNRVELGNPVLPGAVMIRPGQSRGLSAQAFSITPSKTGAFGFRATSFSPQNWGVFSAGHVSVLHSVFSGGAQRWLATLDVTEATVNEGDTGLSAQVTLRDAESEQASAFSRAGSGEALTLHYAVVAPAADLGGAGAADLRFAGSGASAASRPPCARCEAEFGAPLFNGSITLPANASGASIPLPGIVNDSAAEGAERFTLILTGLRNSNGLPLVENGVEIARIGLADGSADYIIAANDGAQAQTATARLRATPRVVLQEDLDADATADQRRANVSSGVITILRPDDVQGVIRGRVRGVDVTTSGAADYTLGDTFEIAASEYSTTVAVSALADDITERNEVFQAEISVTAPNNVRGPESNTEVVILDNDRPITLEVAEAAVSVEENQLLEVKVQAKQGADPAPLRELPVEFLLTPSYPNSGAASPADFLVTVGGQTRVAQSDAEITVTGVLEPGETEASVFFPVADDGDTADEGVTFTVSLPPGNTMVNTLDGAISIGSSAATTATLTAASGGSSNTLVITPTTVTRVYGEAAPTAFAFTVAPQSGSAFATGDSASTTFFDTNPLALAGAADDVAAAGVYRFQFKDSDANTPGLQIDYATDIDTKYDFVLAEGAVYSITPKEITFTTTDADKVYDGTAFAPEFIGTFTETESDDVGHVYVSGGVYGGKDAATAQTITNFGLAGVRAGNYALASASSVTGDITAREISNLKFVVNAHPPGSAAVGTLTPTINRAGITADGVLAAEMDDFRAAGLQFTAAYAATPTARGVNQEVTVSITGDGLADSGAFKAANYTLENTDDVTASGLIADVAGKPRNVDSSRSPDARNAAISWQAPENAGVPNGDITKYHVRWRTVAVEADAPAGVSAAAAGAWQNASGASDLGADVGAATSYIIRGLQPGVGYEVQVVAENEFGEAGRGAYGDSEISVGIPPAPVITSLTATSNITLKYAFSAPLVAAGGATTPLHDFRVIGNADFSFGSGVTRDSRTDREVSFNTHSSLPAGARYEVRMALRNEFGTGPWSKSRFVTTPAGSNAAAPPNFRNQGSVYATSHGGPNIDMHWNPPPGIDATSQVGRYEVQWKLDAATTFASTDKTTLQADGRNTVDGRNAYVIRDLGTAEARYQVQVRACNATGCNSWTNARRNDNTDRIGINYGLGNSDNIDSIDEMIVPYVEALQIGDRSMTVNWRPPLHADGTAIDYGFPITTYRARWRHAIGGTAERKAWLNPSGAAGEPVVNPDPTTNARRSYTISGLQNNTDYQVEFWSERQREDETGVTKVDGYVNAGGKGWTSWVAKLAAGTSPAAVTSVFIPRVVLLGAPQGPQPNSVPALNALTLGDQPGSINASWSAPTNSVSAYQVRWRPYVAGDGKQNWQVADVTGTAHTIAAYTRAGGGANTALREISYEVQVRSRNARGNNAWSAWSSSQRITPPVPELLGLRVFAAENADSNAQTETASVPAFSADVFAYAVEVAEDAGVVWLTPRAADGHTITIGKVGARTPPAVASGARSAAISLAPGATERVEVRVSSTRGGKTETVSYVYALTRPGAPLGPPSGFSVLAGAFDLELAWAGPSGGGEVREFRVRWRTAGVDASGNTPATEPGAWQPSAEGVSTRLAKRRVIGNLQPGTAYQAQVRAVDTAGELGQWSAPLTETPRSFTFDVDGSGASDTTDSIIVGRYLIGVRGSALTAGQTLPDGADLEEITGKLSVGVRDNHFDVDRDGRSSAQDGIMIMRYSFGVTSGAGLTAGQTNEDAANVAETIGDLQQ